MYISKLKLLTSLLPLAYSAVSWASPNSLSGLAGLFYFGAVICAGVTLILLLFAFKVKKPVGRFFLTLPALIWVLSTIQFLFSWDYSGFILSIILYGLLLLFLLVFIYFPELKRGPKRMALVAITLFYCITLVLNPAYTNVVGMQLIDNDPFEGKAMVVKEVIDAGYIHTNEKGQYRVDNYLILDNGKKIPGIFHGFRVGERVLVQELVNGNYAYQVYSEVHSNISLIKPAINFPQKSLFKIKYPKNSISQPKGWGHDYE